VTLVGIQEEATMSIRENRNEKSFGNGKLTDEIHE
jgi:hypothetical protein